MRVNKTISIDPLLWDKAVNTNENMSKLINEFLESYSDDDVEVNEKKLKKELSEIEKEIKALSNKRVGVKNKLNAISKKAEAERIKRVELESKKQELENKNKESLSLNEIRLFNRYKGYSKEELFLKYNTEVKVVSEELFKLRLNKYLNQNK